MRAGDPATAGDVGGMLVAATAILHRAGVPSPAVDARLLVRHATGWTAADLSLRSAESPGEEARAEIERLVTARAARIPLQLLVGRVGFRHLELQVREGVFIPRPETELLVEHALALLPGGGLAVEPCTGSGAVAAALADERRDVRVVATEIDAAAVALARTNTAAVRDRVTVLQGDLLHPVDPGLRNRVDVLVANPPYLADDELPGLQPEVRTADPRRALSSGPTGHEISDRLITLASDWLVPGGSLVMELDASRAAEVARRARAAGLTGVAVRDDLTGRPRFVRAHRPGGSSASTGADRL